MEREALRALEAAAWREFLRLSPLGIAPRKPHRRPCARRGGRCPVCVLRLREAARANDTVRRVVHLACFLAGTED